MKEEKNKQPERPTKTVDIIFHSIHRSKVYSNRRSHSFINRRDEQKINVIKNYYVLNRLSCDLYLVYLRVIGICAHRMGV